MIKVNQLELIIINNYFYLRRRLTNKKKWPIGYYTYTRRYNEGTIKSVLTNHLTSIKKKRKKKKKKKKP